MGADEDDKAIMLALLAEHPAMVPICDLHEVEGVQRPGEALDRLVGDGLVVRFGERAGATLAARRARALLA